MIYLRKIPIRIENTGDRNGAGEKSGTERISGAERINDTERVSDTEGILYVTDDMATANRLKEDGEAVLIALHEGNAGQDFNNFRYAMEGLEEPDAEYAERVYRRWKGLPWKILETDRCVIRETTVGDVDSFYQIYSHPDITKYMENLYPEVEREKQYVREYIEKVYGFYEFGVWTVTEKKTGVIIGRAGFSYREGYDIPELGFIIGVPWQRRGYAEEVCRGILNYGRDRLGFVRVQALVETNNEASLKLCDKLGFCAVEELTLNGRDYFRLLL